MVRIFTKSRIKGCAGLICLMVASSALDAGAPRSSLHPVSRPYTLAPAPIPWMPSGKDRLSFDPRIGEMQATSSPFLASSDVGARSMSFELDPPALHVHASFANPAVAAAADDASRITPRRDVENASAGGDVAGSQILVEHKSTAGFAKDFRARRDILVARMLDADAGQEAQAMLDYAQFLLANMMLPEARGLAERVLAEDHGDPVSRARAQAYRQIVAFLMDPRARTSRDPLPEAWGSDPLWGTLFMANTEDAPRDAADIRAAFDRLGGESPDIIATIIPHIFKMALSARDARLAADIIDMASLRTDLAGSDDLKIMRGSLARHTGDTEAAYDFFMDASRGRGRAAAQARLAIADLAIERGKRGLLPDILQILKEGASSWRGDELGLEIRARLAQVAEELKDVETAILVMTEIEAEHPGTPEAELAEERAGLVMDYLAEQMRKGEIALEEAYRTVRRIGPRSTTHPEWIGVRFEFADLLRRSGLHEAAETELAATWKDVSRIGQASVDGKDLDELVLTHVEVLAEKGMLAEARNVLSRHPIPENTKLMADFARLAVLTGGQTGPAGARLSHMTTDKSPGVVAKTDIAKLDLELARNAEAAQQVGDASDAFDLALGRAPGEMEADRRRALHLAGKLKDADLVEKRSAYLSSEEDQVLGPVIAGLVGEKPDLTLLSKKASRSSLSSAKDTADAVSALLVE